MFGFHFVGKGVIPAETGRFYTKLFGLRHDGDYQDYIDYDQSDVLALIQPTENLINKIQAILFQ